MRRDGVPAKQHLHESSADDARQVRSSAAVHNGRPGDDENPAAVRTNLPDLPRQFFDDEPLRPLARNLARHEGENLFLPRPLRRLHTNPAMTHDDEVALPNLCHRHHPRCALLRRDHDDEIHLGVLHLDPLAAQPNFRRHVRRGVEIVGQRAIARRRLGTRVSTRRQYGAVLLQRAQDAVELRVALGDDFQPRE